MPVSENEKKKSQATTAISNKRCRERSRSKEELLNTDSNMVVVLMEKFGALTHYRKDHLGAGKASWCHWKEHHLHNHFCDVVL